MMKREVKKEKVEQFFKIKINYIFDLKLINVLYQ